MTSKQRYRFIRRENLGRSGILLFQSDRPRFCQDIGKSPDVCPRFEVSIDDRRQFYLSGWDWGGGGGEWETEQERSNLEEDPDVPDSTNLSFHMSGMIANHSRNLGRVLKMETLLIFPICLRPSQTIGDVYDFQFSLVGKVRGGGKTEKSLVVRDFPDI